MKTWYVLLFILGLYLTISCSSQQAVTASGKSGPGSENTSRFAGFEELGIEKEAFIRIYGDPVTKDMATGPNGQRIESLLYIEVLTGNILLKTRFSFENNLLIEQKAETETTYKRELDHLQHQLNILRHQMMFK